jgi:RHS repeat-associated protein
VACLTSDTLSYVRHWQTDSRDTYWYYDSYGRNTGHLMELENSWVRIKALRRTYEKFGRLEFETQPYIYGETQFWNRLTYDLVGRTEQVARESDDSKAPGTYDAETNWTYNLLTTTVEVLNTPSTGTQTTTFLSDALGRTVKVTDSLSGDTDYAYNHFDQLKSVTDDASNVTTIVYNDRGDKTSMTDPDMGTWNYEYTVFGELELQKDNFTPPQEVTFVYDQLGRLDTRDEGEGISSWEYFGAADYKLGLLKSVSSPGGFSEDYDYDTVRRLTNVNTTIDAVSYATDLSYYSSGSPRGKLQRITYPTSTSGVRVKADYAYNNAGFLSTVKDGDAPTTLYYTLNQQDALFRETQATLGNGLVESRTYDKANLLLKTIKTGTGGSIQDLAYQWDWVGNLTQREDLNAQKLEDFTYDKLNRLTTHELNSSVILTVTTNAMGNIGSKSDVGTTYTYGENGAGPHAVTTITGIQSNTYGYDDNGNMIDRDGDTITWYSYNKPKKIYYGTDYSELWYGADRARYKQVAVEGAVTTTTRYVGSHFEVETQGASTIYRHYIRAGDQAVAQYERHSGGTNPVLYLHRDHAGSVVETTNTSGSTSDCWDYDAFGVRTRSCGSAPDDTERGYTGHEQLDSVALIHMNGRVQDPMIGRFISADPIVQAPLFSQSLNRYSYVWNNPLSLVDPSGFQAQGPEDCVVNCGGFGGGGGIDPQVCDPECQRILEAEARLDARTIIRTGRGDEPNLETKHGPVNTIFSIVQNFFIGAADFVLEDAAHSPIGNPMIMGQLVTPSDIFGPYTSPFPRPETPEQEFARDLGPTLPVIVTAAGILLGKRFPVFGSRGLAAKGGASAARGASTAFGRSVQSLKETLGSGKGPWGRVSAHAEQATGRAYRGGTSIEEVFKNAETGEQIIRHTITRGGEILHETFRTYSKFGG